MNRLGGKISFFLLLRLHSFAQERIPDLHNYNLGKGVSTMHETWYQAKTVSDKVKTGFRIRSDDMYESFVTFDSSGYKLEDKKYDEDGIVETVLTYKYDSLKYAVEEDKYEVEKNDTIRNHFAYVFNDGGELVEKVWNTAEGKISRRLVNTYGDNGKVIIENWYGADSLISTRKIFMYDDNGFLVESTEYNSKDEHRWTIGYKRDSVGRTMEEAWYTAGWKFYILYTYRFDEKGNMSELNWCKENGKSYMKWTFEYVYDNKGNWIRQTQFENGKPKAICLREIEYL